MSFYITDIHPDSAHYANRENLISKAVKVTYLKPSERGSGYFSLTGLMPSLTFCGLYVDGVKLTWEDY